MTDRPYLVLERTPRDPGSNRSPACKLSILVVHYQTLDLTLSCLKSIFRFAPAIPFEVIVVDNASNDEIQQAIRGRFPSVRFVQAGSNIGFARANNLAIHNAQGEYLLLLNSDARLTEPFLQEMTDWLDQNPQAGILGPRHVDPYGRFQLSFGNFPTVVSEFARKIIHYRLSTNDFKLRDYLDTKYTGGSGGIDWVSGSCVMLRRSMLEQIGLLDERYFMYFEDIDLCRRAKNEGWGVQYFPQRSIMHIGGASVRKNLLTVMIENRKSQLYFSRKYYGFWAQSLLRCVILMKYGFQMVKWSGVWFARWIMRGKTRKPYLMALVSKKIVLSVLTHVSACPAVPYLQRRVLHLSHHA